MTIYAKKYAELLLEVYPSKIWKSVTVYSGDKLKLTVKNDYYLTTLDDSHSEYFISFKDLNKFFYGPEERITQVKGFHVLEDANKFLRNLPKDTLTSINVTNDGLFIVYTKVIHRSVKELLEE